VAACWTALKSDLGTRHIPVAIVSANDESQRGLKDGLSPLFAPSRFRGEQIDRVDRQICVGYVERSTKQVFGPRR